MRVSYGPYFMQYANTGYLCMFVLLFALMQFVGMLPLSIGSLTDLEVLQLPTSSLGGTLPPTLGSLVNMVSMGFYGNAFTGPFPTFLWRLTKLVYLNLAANSLAGYLPSTSIGGPDTLTYLAIGGNSLLTGMHCSSL